MQTMKNPLIIMALEEEANGQFNGHNVVYTGIGKVNAAYALMKGIHDHKPDHIINLGSAGSSVFPAETLVNCTGFVQRDMDVTPLGVPQWQTPFEAEEIIVK